MHFGLALSCSPAIECLFFRLFFLFLFFLCFVFLLLLEFLSPVKSPLSWFLDGLGLNHSQFFSAYSLLFFFVGFFSTEAFLSGPYQVGQPASAYIFFLPVTERTLRNKAAKAWLGKRKKNARGQKTACYTCCFLCLPYNRRKPIEAERSQRQKISQPSPTAREQRKR